MCGLICCGTCRNPISGRSLLLLLKHEKNLSSCCSKFKFTLLYLAILISMPFYLIILGIFYSTDLTKKMLIMPIENALSFPNNKLLNSIMLLPKLLIIIVLIIISLWLGIIIGLLSSILFMIPAWHINTN